MSRDTATTDKLRQRIARITAATERGEVHWEKQVGSSHRYARINNNLLILGPDAPLGSDTPRYLFITPFDSPACIEINSDDQELGPEVRKLAEQVERATRDESPTDPFAVTEELLSRLD